MFPTGRQGSLRYDQSPGLANNLVMITESSGIESWLQYQEIVTETPTDENENIIQNVQ